MGAFHENQRHADKTESQHTLKLDRDLIREIRILAAEEDTSISALLAVHLQEIVKNRSGYDEAKKRAIARMRKAMISGSLLLGLASSSVSDKLLEDTNLLVYAYDRSAGAKHRVALELVRNIR